MRPGMGSCLDALSWLGPITLGSPHVPQQAPSCAVRHATAQNSDALLIHAAAMRTLSMTVPGKCVCVCQQGAGLPCGD